MTSGVSGRRETCTCTAGLAGGGSLMAGAGAELVVGLRGAAATRGGGGSTVAVDDGAANGAGITGATGTSGELATAGGGKAVVRGAGGAGRAAADGMGFTVTVPVGVPGATYACVIQIAPPQTTTPATVAIARKASKRLSLLNRDVALKRPYPSVASTASVCAALASGRGVDRSRLPRNASRMRLIAPST
jgi:hypothetical protein